MFLHIIKHFRPILGPSPTKLRKKEFSKNCLRHFKAIRKKQTKYLGKKQQRPKTNKRHKEAT